MKIEQPECSETSAYKIQTQGNYPEESIQQEKFLLVSLQFVLSLSDCTAILFLIVNVSLRPPSIGFYHFSPEG